MQYANQEHFFQTSINTILFIRHEPLLRVGEKVAIVVAAVVGGIVIIFLIAYCRQMKALADILCHCKRSSVGPNGSAIEPTAPQSDPAA